MVSNISHEILFITQSALVAHRPVLPVHRPDLRDRQPTIEGDDDEDQMLAEDTKTSLNIHSPRSIGDPGTNIETRASKRSLADLAATSKNQGHSSLANLAKSRSSASSTANARLPLSKLAAKAQLSNASEQRRPLSGFATPSEPTRVASLTSGQIESDHRPMKLSKLQQRIQQAHKGSISASVQETAPSASLTENTSPEWSLPISTLFSQARQILPVHSAFAEVLKPAHHGVQEADAETITANAVQIGLDKLSKSPQAARGTPATTTMPSG